VKNVPFAAMDARYNLT